jgi:alkanesulfonate monooxygenase SsuD/methylene tetrahydromethanopterin reductase-like flavin-dependent oxidoreductase (luciferase family)
VAAGLDPATRGRRLDEALAVCKRLWTEEVIEHRGEFFSFDPVMFEPKPVQKPWPPLHIGGESEAALRRAARASDGWFGLQHDAKSAARIVKRLTDLRRQAGRESHPFAITIGAEVREREDLERFRDAGVDRVMVRPWQGSRDAPDALRRFADRVL